MPVFIADLNIESTLFPFTPRYLSILHYITNKLTAKGLNQWFKSTYTYGNIYSGRFDFVYDCFLGCYCYDGFFWKAGLLILFLYNWSYTFYQNFLNAFKVKSWFSVTNITVLAHNIVIHAFFLMRACAQRKRYVSRRTSACLIKILLIFQPYLVEIKNSLRGQIFDKFLERWDNSHIYLLL